MRVIVGASGSAGGALGSVVIGPTSVACRTGRG
jgi:hypothetical protein